MNLYRERWWVNLVSDQPKVLEKTSKAHMNNVVMIEMKKSTSGKRSYLWVLVVAYYTTNLYAVTAEQQKRYGTQVLKRMCGEVRKRCVVTGVSGASLGSVPRQYKLSSVDGHELCRCSFISSLV